MKHGGSKEASKEASKRGRSPISEVCAVSEQCAYMEESAWSCRPPCCKLWVGPQASVVYVQHLYNGGVNPGVVKQSNRVWAMT